MTVVTNISGNNILVREIPADLKLDNSKRSAILPITITEASNTEIGRASGNNEMDL